MMLLVKKQWGIFLSFSQKWFMASFLFLLQLLPHSALAYSAYSTDELDELEKEFIQLINQSDTVERNPLAFQYINHIGKKLANSARLSMPSFFIVKSNEINAFAGPGGHIGINTQLILATKNESELAAVMAHEIAHVRLHHLYYMLQHQKQMKIPMLASLLASMALGVINPALGSGAMMASLSGFAQDNINFVRSNEKEADRIGIDMLIKAGFNPKGMPDFFKKMQETSRYYYLDNIPAILRTHPLDEDRIAEAENRIQNKYKRPFQDSADYALFKELIRTSVSQNSIELIDFYKKTCQKEQTQDACQYGYALSLLKINRFQQASELMTPLAENHQENLYYQITMAETEIGLKAYKKALNRLENLHLNYPDNYASTMAYGRAIIDAGELDQATNLLLKASRQYKKDLPLCQTLARAQANANQKGYAYFTQSQCMLLEGRPRDAIRLLKVAQNLSKKDQYLSARVEALIDEIKFYTGK